MASGMEAFFAPRSVAVVGASKTGKKLGNVPLVNLRRFGFAGRIIPLHPEGGEVMGLPAFRTLADVDGEVDVAVAIIPRERIGGFIESCGEGGVRNIIVAAAGFADSGPEGTRLQKEIEDIAARRGVRIMGPNSIGTINTETGFVTSIVTLDPVQPGPVSVVAQSGLFASAFPRWVASSQVFGVAKIACLGNKADIDELDVLEYLKDDPATGVIAVHTEGISDGRAFLELASTISHTKPLVMLKVGRNDAGREAAMSHTGSLAGSYEVFKGALSQAGVVGVESFEEMFDCAKALAYCPLPAGNRLGVASITGAGCVLTADLRESMGLATPALTEDTLRMARQGLPPWASFDNPADIWAALEYQGVGKGYETVLRAMALQDDIDMLMAIFTIAPQFEIDVAGIMGGLREDFPGKPLIACILGSTGEDFRRWFAALEGESVPVYESVERAMTAARAMNKYASYRRAAPGRR